PPDGLAQQFALSMQCYEGMRDVHQALEEVRKLRAQLKERKDRAPPGSLAEALTDLDNKAAALEGVRRFGRRGMASGQRSQSTAPATLTRLHGEWATLLGILQGADATPTTQIVAACAALSQSWRKLADRWHELNNKEVKHLNEQLQQTGLPT